MSNTVWLDKGQFNQLMDTDVSVQHHIKAFGNPPCELQRNSGYVVYGGITFRCKELWMPET